MKPSDLAVIVVSWKASPEELRALAEAYREEPLGEAIVVDNSGDAEVLPPFERLCPGRNLGFAGGANFGAEHVSSNFLLFTNPDALPQPGAIRELLRGFDSLPHTAGLAPRLVGTDGKSQFRWQLRPLPRTWQLLAQAFFLDLVAGPRVEPEAGARIPQPAAAVLALQRSVFWELGGFDAGYWPAWFEDVDLARRLWAQGQTVRYWPSAVFRHHRGGSLPALGYGPFLEAYGRNLMRYLLRHHGPAAATAFRHLAPLGAWLRLLLLPVRTPRREPDRERARRALEHYLRAATAGFPDRSFHDAC